MEDLIEKSGPSNGCNVQRDVGVISMICGVLGGGWGACCLCLSFVTLCSEQISDLGWLECHK